MKAYGLSHVGKVRSVNQDAFYLPRMGETFAVVADGMGGHKAGEVASALAVREFVRWLRCAPRPTEASASYAVHEANRLIHRTAQRDEDKSNMGTTLVALWLDDDRAILANVGDSRAYLMRDGKLVQMSRDHSLVAELVAQGKISEEEARVHPQRNLVTRAVGTSSLVNPDVITFDRKANDLWLLCSDGLTNHVSDEQIGQVLSASASLEEKTQTLIDLALQHGGSDNVTAVLVDCEEAYT